jgi:hypothetical protein
MGSGLPAGPYTSGADLRFAQVFTGTNQQEYSTPRNADVRAIAAALAAAGDPSMTINTPHAVGAAGSDVGKSTSPILGYARKNMGSMTMAPGRKREYYLPSGDEILATGEHMSIADGVGITLPDMDTFDRSAGLGCACRPGRKCKCAGKCKRCANKEKLAVGGSSSTASGHMYMCGCSKCKLIAKEHLISQGTFPAFWETSPELDKYRDDDRLNYFGLD